MRNRFLILLNPNAGQNKRAFVERCARALEGHGAAVRLEYCARRADSRALARDALKDGGVDAVVAAGGDGTISNIARCLLGSELPLGVIPAGTANVLAREIGLRQRPVAVARCLIAGATVAVHGGFANDFYFVLMAGAGIDGAIVRDVNRALKRKWGKLAFAPAILRLLARARHREFEVRNAAMTARAPWAIVTNARLYAGSFRLVKNASVAKPGLHLMTIAGATRGAVMANLAALALGRLEAMPGVTVTPCDWAALGADIEVPLQIDGSSRGMTPARVRVNDAPFQLIVPPGFSG